MWCVFAARAGCTPSASAPPVPEARLLSLRPSPRRASWANMGQEEELLRIAKKLEKMVARKNTVRLQSLGHSLRPREARRGQALVSRGLVLAGSPGGAGGTQYPREARLVQDSAPLGDCWAPRSGLVHGSGRRGNRAGPEVEARAHPLDVKGSGGPGSIVQGP